MRFTKKSKLRVVSGTILVIGIVVLASIVFHIQTSTNLSQTTTPRVMRIQASLAHNFTSLGELKGASTLIVVGTMITQKTEIGNHGTPWTLSTLSIERTLMGKSAVGQTVVVKQMGGRTSDGTQWIMDGFPLLKIGTRYVLFLTPSLTLNVFYTVGAPQGVFLTNTNGEVDSLAGPNIPTGVAVQHVALATFIQNVQSASVVPLKQ